MTIEELLEQVRALAGQYAHDINVLVAEREDAIANFTLRIALLEDDLETLEEVEELLMGLVAVIPADVGAFVATDGNDSTGDGSEGAPYLTITKARDEIRLANNVSPIRLMTGGYFLGGTAIDLTTSDHGLTVRAHTEQTPVIHQGEEVTGSWADEGGGLWSKAWTNACEDLFIDSVRARRAQFPAWDAGDPYEGIYLTAESVADNGADWDIIHRVGDGFPALTDVAGAKVLYQSGNGGWNWEIATINSYTSGTRAINIIDLQWAPRAGCRYFVFDIPKQASKALTQGEFWYDGVGNKIWYHDSGFIGDGSEQVVAGQEVVHFNITGDGITLDGLTLTSGAGLHPASPIYWQGGLHSRAAVTIVGGDNNTVQNCTIYNTAGGVGIATSATGNTVTLNTIYDVYGVGVGSRNVADNLTVSENLIHDVGQYHHRDKGIEFQEADSVTVSHNDIYNCPASAIFGASNSTPPSASDQVDNFVVEYNDISNVGLETGDVGGIYIRGLEFGDQSGVVRYNSVVNMRSRNTESDGSWVRFEDGFAPSNEGISAGIYLDDQASGNDVYGNFIKDTGHAYFRHGGFENLFRENFCVNCSAVDQDENKKGDWAGDDWNECRNNIFYFEAAADQPTQMLVAMQYVHDEDDTSILHYDNNNYYFEDGFPIAEFARLHWTGPTHTFATWKGTFLASAHADDTGSITTDPEFTDPSTDDWTLQGTSPALDPPVSIPQIPFSSIGRT